MDLLKKRKFWRITIFSLLVLLVLGLFWSVRAVLTPFAIAYFLAYLLSPTVGGLCRRGLSRGAAIAVVYLALLISGASFVFFGIPEMFKELNKFAESLPRYAGEAQELAQKMYLKYQQAGLPPGVAKTIDSNLLRGEAWLGENLQGIITALISLISILPLIVLAPILSIYMLYDWENFKLGMKEAIPQAWRGSAIHLGQETSMVLRKFLRGNLTVAAMVGVMTGLGMKLVGMDYALLIGVISGLFDLIPYFGPVIGAVPALVLALLKSPGMALWVLVVIFVVQQLESNVIQPKIMGDSLGLHPLVIVFFLLAGGELFGFWGMLLAVPVAGVLRVLLTFIYLKLV